MKNVIMTSTQTEVLFYEEICYRNYWTFRSVTWMYIWAVPPTISV